MRRSTLSRYRLRDGSISAPSRTSLLALPGVPLDKASAALQEGVVQTYRELDIDHVNRNWLDIVAVRT